MTLSEKLLRTVPKGSIMTDEEIALRDPLWRSFLFSKQEYERLAARVASNDVEEIESLIFSEMAKSIGSFLEDNRKLFDERLIAVERTIREELAEIPTFWFPVQGEPEADLDLHRDRDVVSDKDCTSGDRDVY